MALVPCELPPSLAAHRVIFARARPTPHLLPEVAPARCPTLRPRTIRTAARATHQTTPEPRTAHTLAPGVAREAGPSRPQPSAVARPATDPNAPCLCGLALPWPPPAPQCRPWPRSPSTSKL
ncbi:hypothetical protein HYPSUDRAFT_197731 [Hypholoma sublateritium FD-334 SS-4]|uniref:Uncharacterized protein n=1 Tax=Hypholoma sublateritium (strain FD-334 SS-4) TaxID=945553 RepID=A0A0D2MW99_HYPSF|nr:hypothetical protein HYPSUDRAFT_197731 [Hypholoma sublateritium FD-334 SS-4]